MARSNPGYPVDPNRAELAEAIEESRNLRVMAPPPMPLPPPSRRPPAQFAAAPPLSPPAPPPLQPQPEAPNVDWNAPTVDASELEIEENPFQKKRRWPAWLSHGPAWLGHRLSHRPAWLKKPSREMSLRGGIAVLALAVGWGIGAKPWKRSRTNAPAHVVAAHSAPKKPALAVHAAQASHIAKPAPYRTASISHAAPAKPGAVANANRPALASANKPALKASTKPAVHAVSAKPAVHAVNTKPAAHAVNTKPAAHAVNTKPTATALSAKASTHTARK